MRPNPSRRKSLVSKHSTDIALLVHSIKPLQLANDNSTTNSTIEMKIPIAVIANNDTRWDFVNFVKLLFCRQPNSLSLDKNEIQSCSAIVIPRQSGALVGHPWQIFMQTEYSNPTLVPNSTFVPSSSLLGPGTVRRSCRCRCFLYCSRVFQNNHM